MKKIFKNAAGMTLIELLVSMAIAGILMGAALTIFKAGMDVRNEQTNLKNTESGLRVGLDYISSDIAQAGAYMGDHTYFNYYSGSVTPNRRFCVNFDPHYWPDFANLQAAWEARFSGWYLEYYSEDMVEIWYADANVYSKIKNANITNIMNFDIEDNPVERGFQAGDYILFYDSTKDAMVGNDYIRGATSSANWLTVLTKPVEYSGELTRGELQFEDSLPFTDYYRTPYGYNFTSCLNDKGQFLPPDRIYKVHRVVYGVMTKSVGAGANTKTVKMLVRDNFSDSSGTSRYNPLVVATEVDQFKLTTVFKRPPDEAGSYPENWNNAVRMNYYNNSPGKMFGSTLVNALTMDPNNTNLKDFDPRDLRKIQIELSSVSSKRFMQQAGNASTAPKVFFAPAMGVMKYPTGAGDYNYDIRVPGSTTPDWHKHRKLTSEVGLRTLRLKDFAVSPE